MNSLEKLSTNEIESQSLLDLEFSELKEWIKAHSLPEYRAIQVHHWLYKKGVIDPCEMSDLPLKLRTMLKSKFKPINYLIVGRDTSKDGTTKIRIKLEDKSVIETVLIPEKGDKITQCISTQVGCPMGCIFCNSGKNGFKRNLTTGEIVFQYVIGKKFWPEHKSVTNIVIMGSGEPLLNYNNLKKALKIISSPHSISISPRRITVSTVGIPEGISQLGKDFNGKIGLALSLHSADQKKRGFLIPKYKKWDLEQIKQALTNYPLPPRRRITIEYVLIKGINDSYEDAIKLLEFTKGLRVKINLIPLNPINDDNSDYKLISPPRPVIYRFQNILLNNNLTVTIRKQRGDDIKAACGQLIGASSIIF